MDPLVDPFRPQLQHFCHYRNTRMQEAFTATWWEKSAVKIKDFSWWLAGLVRSINSLFLDYFSPPTCFFFVGSIYFTDQPFVMSIWCSLVHSRMVGSHFQC
jgi:hypothetical protein